MEDRTELLNALRLIKDHCASVELCTKYTCSIYFECDSYLITTPEKWDLEDGEPVEE